MRFIKPLTLVISIVLIILFGLNLFDKHRELDELQSEADRLEQKLIEFQSSGKDEVTFEDPELRKAYLEREARIRLHYKKPEEEVVYVYTQDPAKQETEPEIEASIPALHKWWNYLIGR